MNQINLPARQRRVRTGLGAAAAGTLLWAAVPSTAAADAALADLIERVNPSVVTVFTTQNAPADAAPGMPFGFPEGSPFEEFFRRFGMPDGMPAPRGSAPQHALGSGFILDSDGYVITNNHVVEDATEVKVRLDDKRELIAKVIGTDRQTDLALLKLDAKNLPHVTLGDSDKLRVGDDVFAVGNPFGLGGTVTSGIVSALARDINAGPYVDFIQTDAAINRGNSGGPLFDREGNVIGVNSAIYSPNGGSVGVGFAIPSNTVKTVVAALRDGGSVARGWLGVAIQGVTPEIAEALDLAQPKGALVASVVDDGPARSALKPGDVIMTFDGKPVHESRDLPKLVGATKAGSSVEIEILRNGKQETVKVKICALPAERHAANSAAPDSDGAAASAKLGATVAPLSPGARQRLGLDDDVDGAVVTSLKGDGPASSAGLQVGDVIVQVGGEPIAGPSELETALGKLETDAALLLVNRRGDQIFVGVKLAA
jgi:serine protease Do